jgi:peptidyl-prolyl cis-trans isomerase D
MTEDYFWNQLQYDQMFARVMLSDEKGNFKTQELKKQILEDTKATES